ncbi:glycoside hydrolase domain-containing protein [Streptomyces sp. NBC_01618]|uniref:glycoside hydrolase domain-containing protein n=1 Tax=Streptomyces sp. NBC_01618 TaxID=2975900 RepID=UPI0038695B65|nr:glycoside hydrolase family 92 protein [Streptomyces sp. NBC_01618]
MTRINLEGKREVTEPEVSEGKREVTEPKASGQLARRRLLLSAGGVLAAGVAGVGGSGGIARAAAPGDAVSAKAGRDYVRLVNPWVEADRGRFFFFQSASNPFGMIKLRPDTSTNTLWGTGYRHDENNVKGFSHLHCWQIAGVQVMPTTGASVSKLQGDTGWQSSVKHDASEVVEPGYHRLHLDRYGVTAELTCTDRVGLHRYTYDNADRSEIVINLGGMLGEAKMKGAHVTKVSNAEIEGYVDQGGYLTDGLYWPQTPPEKNRLFFSIRFDRPFDSLRGWVGGSLANGGAAIEELSGDNMGVYVCYEQLDAGAVVQMKVGLSFTGAAGARKNLQAELPGWDFEAVKQASQQHWNAMMGRIEVEGGSEQQQVKFYTDLFHVLCGRSTISDVDGKYLDNTWRHGKVKQIPLDDRGVPRFAMYNYDALWLTQWNLNTVLGFAYPEIYSSFVHSQLQMYQDGGLLPRGPRFGDDSFVMTGSAVTSFITGAWNKGIRDFDINLAFDAMLDAQSIGGLFDKATYANASWMGDGGVARPYLDHGYVPHNMPDSWKSRGAGETLEFAFQDWTLGQLARRLGKTGLNVSQFAEVSVSSQVNDSNFAGVRAVDGRPIRSSMVPSENVEWASTERKPWIKLSWREEKRVHKVVISDRADPRSNANSGVLTFSDGSTIAVSNIPTDGRNKVVAFRPRQVSWVRFEVTGGTGENVGLNEIEVWDTSDTGAYLIERSGNWQNLFDRSTGFIRPRGSDGRWLASFNPLSSNDFVEANSWQATWYTPHDVTGLANRLGGMNAYADKLNYAFDRSKGANFIGEEGGNGDDGAYVNYGNQPGLQLAHLFNYVGKPWLTQYWVRQVKEKVYSSISTTDGYGHHDEDQGQMGSLSALMAIGLFEVTGASLSRPVYDITSPIFDKVAINLNAGYYSGGQFRIVTHDNSAANMYIQRATLNGKELDQAWFYHDQLTGGGTLELWMGDQPNKAWGVKQLPPSHSPQAPAVIYSTPDQVRVGPGENGTVRLEAKNLTGEAVTVKWRTNAPAGLRTVPASGTLTVPAGGTTGQDLTLRVAEDIPEELHRITFTAVSADGTELPDGVLYVNGIPAISVSTAPAELRLLQDTPATFQVRLVDNDSQAQDTEVSLQTPQGWQVEPATRTLQLAAGATATPTFTVTPPASASGAQTLVVTVKDATGTSHHEVSATVHHAIAVVGAVDVATAGFALTPNRYSAYPSTFPNGVDFTVGSSDPASAWSYIHPGPSDAWAGSRSHTFTLRFDLPQTPENDLALTAWLVDTQQTSPPKLALSLNEQTATTIQLPAGGGDGYHWGDGRGGNIRPTIMDFPLPTNQLRAGKNVITITTQTGSWAVYDAIAIREATP